VRARTRLVRTRRARAAPPRCRGRPRRGVGRQAPGGAGQPGPSRERLPAVYMTARKTASGPSRRAVGRWGLDEVGGACPAFCVRTVGTVTSVLAPVILREP